MYHKLDQCPVCRSKDIQNLIICKDHFLTGESFAINECRACTFRFTNPRPVNEELDKYYQAENYASHSTKSSNLLDFIYRLVRTYTLKRKLNLVNSLSAKGRLLDVGCGTGEFLHTCRSDGWNVDGVEKNEKARMVAENRLGQPIDIDLSGKKNVNPYHIITLWHVLEHLPDLHDVVSSLKSILTGKGYLVVAVPNHNSYDARKYKSYWAAYDVPRHLSHFNQKSVKTLARLHDLRVKQILPMKFDAFYVSLLSEKYRNKSNIYLRSFLTGLKSNRYARKNNNEYSSLIYILRK